MSHRDRLPEIPPGAAGGGCAEYVKSHLIIHFAQYPVSTTERMRTQTKNIIHLYNIVKNRYILLCALFNKTLKIHLSCADVPKTGHIPTILYNIKFMLIYI